MDDQDDEKIKSALLAAAKEIADEMLAVETDSAKRQQIKDRLALYVETGGTLQKPN